MMRAFQSSLVAAVFLALAAGCGGASAGEDPAARPSPSVPRDSRAISFDPTPIYRQMGLIARGTPFPITGRIATFASAQPDTAHVVVALAFSSSALSFAREADNRYRARYTITISVDRGAARVKAIEATETVLVSTYRETTRTDENLLFQEIIDLAPGQYAITVGIRDQGSQRSTEEQVDVVVPALRAGRLSSPVPVSQVAPRYVTDIVPSLLVQPRATVAFGRDSVLPVYIENYQPTSDTIRLVARNESGRVMWTQPVAVPRHNAMGSGVVMVPVQRLGIGVSEIAFVRDDAADTTSTFVFVGFGEGLPVARFDDMLQLLRYFATSSRLTALRSAAEEDRPAAWQKFLQETDSIPATPYHEDLIAYFTRLSRANTRFRDEAGPGWMSDRGRVFIVLGEPDGIMEQTNAAFQRGRQQMWEYIDEGLRLIFYDQSGNGDWRLAQASSVRFESEFRKHLR